MPYDPFEIGDDYGAIVQQKLEEILPDAPPRRLALVIRKTLENMVLAERIAAEQGVAIADLDKRRMLHSRHAEIQAEVDRALGEFIGAIVSAEGG